MGVVVNFPVRLLLGYEDSRLGDLHPPPCQSCLRRSAQVKRSFEDGDVFVVCEDCL